MTKFITLLILACTGSVFTFAGRFWLYDGELECDFRDDIKILLSLADILKDATIYFILLSHLLK